MKRKKIIIGNWKMNPPSLKLAEKLVKNIGAGKINSKAETVICPPFPYILPLKKISKKITFGVQNISDQESGAFTGEVSGAIAYDIGARYAILGHSERRSMGESDSLINRKIKLALKEGLTPVLCVGEKMRDMNHQYFKIIDNQLSACLAGLNKNSVDNLIIAYEPIWAIGTFAEREAIPEEFREVSVYIRKFFSDHFGAKSAMSLRVIYGGSVNPKNAEGFIKEGEADGFLVGRDSLDARKFLSITEIVSK